MEVSTAPGIPAGDTESTARVVIEKSAFVRKRNCRNLLDNIMQLSGCFLGRQLDQVLGDLGLICRGLAQLLMATIVP
jgi:hypothetical protein